MTAIAWHPARAYQRAIALAQDSDQTVLREKLQADPDDALESPQDGIWADRRGQRSSRP